MENFQSLGLPQPLLDALDQLSFVKPTPIQAQAIPLALAGRDVLGTAQTGTGKTGAFGIPVIAQLLNNPKQSALILTPTRELAMQVMAMMMKFVTPASGVRGAVLIGGEPMPKQFQQLKCNPRLIVGTPGRINDHLLRGSLTLGKVGVLVLDEMDRMLDMGFGVQLEQIAEYLPEKRQTLMFSATLPPDIVKASKKYLNNPERVAAGSTTATASRVSQEMLHVSETEKYPQLLTELSQREGSIIVFVKTKWNADKLADKLSKENHEARAIHGDLRQNQRDRTIRHFREKKYRIMVATDVAARGLDIPHIEHVINYDLPQCPEDYIHRIGRTARAGAEGAAVNLIAPIDREKWRAIHRLLNPDEKYTGPSGESRGGGSYRDFQKGKPRPKFGKKFAKKGEDFESQDEASPREVKYKGGFKSGDKGHFKDAKKEGFKKDGFKKEGFKKEGFKKEGFRNEGFKERNKSASQDFDPLARVDFAARPVPDHEDWGHDVRARSERGHSDRGHSDHGRSERAHNSRGYAGRVREARGYETRGYDGEGRDGAERGDRSLRQKPAFAEKRENASGPRKGFSKTGAKDFSKGGAKDSSHSSKGSFKNFSKDQGGQRFGNEPQGRPMSHPQARVSRGQDVRGGSSSSASSGPSSPSAPRKAYKSPYAAAPNAGGGKKGYIARKNKK